jgi:hypothetical protein
MDARSAMGRGELDTRQKKEVRLLRSRARFGIGVYRVMIGDG